jgi:DNA repair exonuclease SbcCD ATPase subunit
VQLLRLEVRNWVHHRHRVCEFTRGLVAILGENGSGKSSLFGALKWLLTGENPNYGVKADNVSQYAKEGEPAFATLEFEHSGHIACVTRHLLPANEQATFTLDGVEKARGDKAVTKAIEELLGVDAKFISRFIIVGQTEIFSFIDDSQTETDKFFQRLFNTAKADKCQDALGKNLAKISIPEVLTPASQLQEQCDQAKAEVAKIDAELSQLPSMNAYFDQQTADQKIIQDWEARARAGNELAKIDSEATTLAKQLATAQEERDRHQADIQALDEASQGQEASISAARTALGHWQSYKSVAKAKAALQKNREDIIVQRKANPPPAPVAVGAGEELTSQISIMRKQLRDRRDFVKVFVEQGQAHCPTCHTPTTQLAPLIKQTQEIDIPQFEAAISEAEAQLAEYQALVAAHKAWDKLNHELSAREQQIAQSEARLEDVVPPALSEDELSQTVLDYDSFQKARQAIAPLLQAAASKFARLEGQHASLRDRHTALSAQIAEASVTQADVHQARTRLTKLSELLAARDKLTQARSEAAWRLREADRAFCQAQADEQKAAKLRTWVARAERAREALKNAPRLVAQRNLQRLEAAINELLRIFQVNFQVKVAEDGTPAFIAEFYDGRRQVAQRLSIGQKTVLALAFRVAVNAQFAEEIGLLALDEPTASLDQPRIQALAPVLENLRELSTAKGLQCLMVTHAASLSNLFESAIELEPPELRHATSNG